MLNRECRTAEGFLRPSSFICSLFVILFLSSSSAAAPCAASAALGTAAKAEADPAATARGSCPATQWVPGFLAETPAGSGTFTFRSCSISCWHLAHLLSGFVMQKINSAPVPFHGDPAAVRRKVCLAYRDSSTAHRLAAISAPGRGRGRELLFFAPRPTAAQSLIARCPCVPPPRSASALRHPPVASPLAHPAQSSSLATA